MACDFAVAGVGINPDVQAVAGSSVAQENGILVDELCRTSAADVYAAGDVANQLHPLFGRVRVEHYNNGEKQGAAAARSMLGSTAPYDYLHTFWSDQYEHKLEYVGHATSWDDFAVRGSLEDGKLVGFYLSGRGGTGGRRPRPRRRSRAGSRRRDGGVRAACGRSAPGPIAAR